MSDGERKLGFWICDIIYYPIVVELRNREAYMIQEFSQVLGQAVGIMLTNLRAVAQYVVERAVLHHDQHDMIDLVEVRCSPCVSQGGRHKFSRDRMHHGNRGAPYYPKVVLRRLGIGLQRSNIV